VLFAAVEPPRQELFRRINLALAEPPCWCRCGKIAAFLPTRTALKPVDVDFAHLLASWFNRGFLALERIDWHTPAVVLEKLIQHELSMRFAAGTISGDALPGTGVGFAFFHPALPDEPLIFVEGRSDPGTLPLHCRPCWPRMANRSTRSGRIRPFFISISNCLDGLRGISFGNFLIKQVVAELEAEDLNLGLFATLITGAWVSEMVGWPAGGS